MKQHKVFILTALALGFMSCSDEMTDNVNFNVTTPLSENVSLKGDTVVVKAGTPLTFNFVGNPNNITLYSGEPGHVYAYKTREFVDPTDVLSSTLSFTVTFKSGSAATAKDALKMYIADKFPGLSKNDFNRDSVAVENFQWTDLLDQSELPQAPVTKTFEIDLTHYLNKPYTLAILYQPKDNSAAQPRVEFQNMVITNIMKDHTQTILSASDFGFTPLNMLWRHNLTDQSNLPANNRAYGTVTNNTSGVWNFTGIGDKGLFFIHSSSKTAPLKYSWLVSDQIVTNRVSPDQGQAIKTLATRLDTYAYTYTTPGVYKATFIAVNSNYKKESSIVKELNVKVIP